MRGTELTDETHFQYLHRMLEETPAIMGAVRRAREAETGP